MEKLILWMREEAGMLIVIAIALGISLFALTQIDAIEKDLEKQWSDALQECYDRTGYKEMNYTGLKNIDNIRPPTDQEVEQYCKEEEAKQIWCE